jgi:hypothetical protein
MQIALCYASESLIFECFNNLVVTLLNSCSFSRTQKEKVPEAVSNVIAEIQVSGEHLPSLNKCERARNGPARNSRSLAFTCSLK